MYKKLKISLAVAVGANGEIGKENALLWHLPGDLQYFKRLTTGHHLIMGRKTFESIGRALPDRISVVISADEDFIAKLNGLERCIGARSIEQALDIVQDYQGDLLTHPDEPFVVGGEQIYRQFLSEGIVDTVYLTMVDGSFEADAFFPIDQLKQWRHTLIESHPCDDKNTYSFQYYILDK